MSTWISEFHIKISVIFTDTMNFANSPPPLYCHMVILFPTTIHYHHLLPFHSSMSSSYCTGNIIPLWFVPIIRTHDSFLVTPRFRLPLTFFIFTPLYSSSFPMLSDLVYPVNFYGTLLFSNPDFHLYYNNCFLTFLVWPYDTASFSPIWLILFNLTTFFGILPFSNLDLFVLQ